MKKQHNSIRFCVPLTAACILLSGQTAYAKESDALKSTAGPVIELSVREEFAHRYKDAVCFQVKVCGPSQIVYVHAKSDETMLFEETPGTEDPAAEEIITDAEETEVEDGAEIAEAEETEEEDGTEIAEEPESEETAETEEGTATAEAAETEEDPGSAEPAEENDTVTVIEETTGTKEKADFFCYEKSVPIMRTKDMVHIFVEARDFAGNSAIEKCFLYLKGRTPRIRESVLQDKSVRREFSGKQAAGNDVLRKEKAITDTITDTVTGKDSPEEKADEQSFSPEGEASFGTEDLAREQSADRRVLPEDPVVDLQPPVVKRFAGLGEQYYQSFSVPYSVEEMTEDQSEVTVEYRLDGLRYDGTNEVTAPGLHVLKAVFTDAFAHETEEEIRFVITDTDPSEEEDGAEAVWPEKEAAMISDLAEVLAEQKASLVSKSLIKESVQNETKLVWFFAACLLVLLVTGVVFVLKP